MPRELIDDSGNIWIAGDPLLAATLRTRMSGDALFDFAIVNMGWIGVDRSKRSLRIKCRPAFVAELALVKLLFLVHDQPDRALALELLGGRAQSFVLRDRRTFTRFLASLVAASQASAPCAKLLSFERSERDSPFRASARIAQGLAAGSPAIDDAFPAFQKLFRGRWSLYTLDGERGHTRNHAIGNAYTPFNPSWLSAAQGQSLCAYADDAYGLWVAKWHRSTIQQRTILFDDVDAIVSFPHVGATRLRYSRVTIPIFRTGGQAFILSAAISDDAIDLRKPAAHEIH